jgi:hypothetical protein
VRTILNVKIMLSAAKKVEIMILISWLSVVPEGVLVAGDAVIFDTASCGGAVVRRAAVDDIDEVDVALEDRLKETEMEMAVENVVAPPAVGVATEPGKQVQRLDVGEEDVAGCLPLALESASDTALGSSASSNMEA